MNHGFFDSITRSFPSALGAWRRDLRIQELTGRVRWARRLAVLFVILIVLGTTIGIMVPAGPGWDFANFYDTGRRVIAWQIGDLYDPESWISGQPPQGNMLFMGSPISALFYAPLGLLSPAWALIAFKIQNTLCYFVALGLLYLHLRRHAGRSAAEQWQYLALFTGLSLLYQPFWTIYRVGGQTTPTVLLLFTVALLTYLRGNLWPATVCLCLALLIKPGLVFILVPLLLVSGWRFFRLTAISFLTAGTVSWLLLGREVHAIFIRTMIEKLGGGFPWFYNSSLYVTGENLKLLANPAVNGRAVDWTTLGIKLLVLAIFGLLYRESRREKWREEARRHFCFMTAIAFSLMISQTVWEHYLAMIFPLLAYVVAARRHFSTFARGLIGAVFLLAIGQNLILVNLLRYRFSIASIPELILIGLFKSGPLLLILVFMWCYRHEVFRSYAAPEWNPAPGK